MDTTPTPEQVLSKAIEVKQAVEEAMKIVVKPGCGFYGNQFVHFEWCRCDYEEDALMDSRL